MAKLKIPKSGYYFDFETHTLHMSHRFSVKASDPESDDFKVYQRYRELFPKLKVEVHKPKRRKNPSISYEKMVDYITQQDNASELLKEFNRVKLESKDKKNPYKHVYDWFTTKFELYGKTAQKAS